MFTTNFDNFNQTAYGRVVTGFIATTSYGESFEILIVKSRNSYGSHNVVAIDAEDGKAFVYGKEAVEHMVSCNLEGKKLRKVLRKIYMASKQRRS